VVKCRLCCFLYGRSIKRAASVSRASLRCSLSTFFSMACWSGTWIRSVPVPLHSSGINGPSAFYHPSMISSFLLTQVDGPSNAPRLPLWFIFLPRYWRRGRDSARCGFSPDHDTTLPLIAEGRSSSVAAVSVKHLSKLYGDWGAVGGMSVKALDDVTLEFTAGRVTAILGHNGAGGLVMGERDNRACEFVINQNFFMETVCLA
jgi:hypothetical protein